MAKRQKLRKVISIIHKHDNDTFYTIEDVRFATEKDEGPKIGYEHKGLNRFGFHRKAK